MGEAEQGRDEGRGAEPWRRPYAIVLWAIPAAILALELFTIVWALRIDSRQLLKDGLDWSYDVALYGVVALIFGRGAQAERVAAGFVGIVMFVAGAHTLWDLWDKIVAPRPIDPFVLSFSAGSAIVVALAIVAAILPFRRYDNPVVLATWLSSRNDAISTTLYSLLNLAARATPETRWPEWGLDLFAAGLAFQAAWAVAASILKERRRAVAPAQTGVV
ncbi:MAG: hypothetical protein JNK46_20465 [Methylobacteriaceae bacterium]|nr:hypothetical protein [Methylobacteriaceae bacterium]